MSNSSNSRIGVGAGGDSKVDISTLKQDLRRHLDSRLSRLVLT